MSDNRKSTQQILASSKNATALSVLDRTEDDAIKLPLLVKMPRIGAQEKRQTLNSKIEKNAKSDFPISGVYASKLGVEDRRETNDLSGITTSGTPIPAELNDLNADKGRIR